ncbi:amidase family protein [Clostridium sp. CF012]|uniref:amidase family protein n=1 Tax=Clostridium sp. CF012 TaxID=2843319 RepID=UPI001C0B8873|nr:amidase family protein [Clostridium sp. CF012]MBU3145818.1 amidase [Clostridium sp. CF012]
MDNNFEQMLRISKATVKANKLLNITVDRVNEDAALDTVEILNDNTCPIFYGVKNTKAVRRKYINNLAKHNKYVWHTIDSMADGGRAIDIRLTNPLTGKIMTGSSSATAINVLYGINDVGIGSDGGGSVLAPAISLNLYSIMAKGMGLKANYSKKSTDGIDFTAGVGVISHSLKIAKECIYNMADMQLTENYCEDELRKIKIAVPCIGNITLPNGKDMRESLNDIVSFMKKNGIEIYEERFPDFNHREDSIIRVNELLCKYDILITFEGPIDLEGLGDSVFGNMGSFAKEIQNRSGKYLVKIANMVNATAVTIPANEVASGIVMVSREGIDNGICVIELAEKISSQYIMPQLYIDYFKKSYLRRKYELIFNTDGDED